VEERRYWGDFEVTKAFVGDGAQARDASPIEHADSFKVPVLLFHGRLDRNVSYEQSERMAARRDAAAKRCVPAGGVCRRPRNPLNGTSRASGQTAAHRSDAATVAGCMAP